MRIAAITLGSNSFHVLIAEITGPSSFEPVLRQKLMIQLGKKSLITGRLDPQDFARGLRCLNACRLLMLSRRVEKTLAVATSAIREAENGEEFLRRARRATGLHIRTLSGREETRLTHLAVSRHGDLRSERALIIDLGGGSVGLSVGDAQKIHSATSTKLGFLRLQGRFVTRDPMSKREAATLRGFLKDSLAGALTNLRKRGPTRALAAGGSMTAMLRLAQEGRQSPAGGVAGSAQVTLDEIRAMTSDLLALPAPGRSAKLGLDLLRAETLPTALLTLEAILEGAGLNRVGIVPVGLNEGLIHDFLQREGATAPAPALPDDPRMQGILDLAVRCDYAAEHAHRVAVLADQIFWQTLPLHGLGAEESRLLRYGAVLHDIGYHIAVTRHHKHGYTLVMNGELSGMPPGERGVIACLVRYHRRALPRRSHAAFGALPPRGRRTVAALEAILRIADALDLSHFSLVDAVEIRPSRTRLVFTLRVNDRARRVPLDIEAVKSHARYFEKLFGVEAVFRTRRPPRLAPAAEPSKEV